jgi:hypothetical protein
MHFEALESRRLFAGEPGVLADLQVDANRDGRIDAKDFVNEDRWTPGRGAIILPNLDRDNRNTGAPDNWSGGYFNGKPAAPNNIIDNGTDLADIGVIRLAKLKTLEAYNYTLRPGGANYDRIPWRAVRADTNEEALQRAR